MCRTYIVFVIRSPSTAFRLPPMACCMFLSSDPRISNVITAVPETSRIGLLVTPILHQRSLRCLQTFLESPFISFHLTSFTSPYPHLRLHMWDGTL
jgi:hypothetical protein